LKGRAHTALGQLTEALRSFTESSKLNDDDVAIWLGRQAANAKLQNLAAAKQNYQSARRCYRAVAYDRYVRWAERMSLWPQGREEDLRAVLKDYTREIEAGVKDGWAWRGRGLANVALGRWTAGLADFTQAITADPKDFDAYHDRGRVNAELGRWDHALSDWDHALKLEPGDWSAWCFVGLARARKGQDRDAVAAYSMGIEMGANGWPPLEGRALALERLGRLDQADADLSQAIRIGGGGWRIFHQRGLIRARKELWNEAADDFTAAIDLTAEAPDVWHDLALAQLACGRYALYQGTCKALLNRFNQAEDLPTTRSLIETCILAHGALDDPTPVLKLAKRITMAQPERHDELSLMGAVLYRAGRFSEALICFDKAIAAHSSKPKGTVRDWLYMAMVQYRLGHYTEAKKCWTEAGKFDHIVEEWARQATQDTPMGALEASLLRDEVKSLIQDQNR
jgi:tetratricopeptide (TPR) repeat protein